MNNRSSSFTLLTSMVVAMCASLTIAGSGQNRQVGLPSPGTVESLGVNIHFTDPAPGELEQLAAAGFKWVRMDFAWAGIENTKGVYDFSAYDRLITILNKHALRAILILDYGNDLYEKGAPRTEAARSAFASFAAAAVRHFKGNGILWEMWNEPNGGFWNPRANVDEYIRLAVDTGKAIRTAAPHELYIGPATSGMDFNFIEACFRAGLLKYWDAVSFHPYRNSNPETAIPDFHHIKKLIQQYAPRGKRIPILSGEWGYSELYPGLNLELQGKYIAREFLTNIAQDLVVSIWYDWHDDGPDPKEPEHHFGSVYADYRPKPAYIAAKTLSSTLRGFKFNKMLALGKPGDYCLLFTAPGGRTVLAAWTTNRDDHEVMLPASPGRLGMVATDGTIFPVEASSAGLKVRLSGTPVYIVSEGPDKVLTKAAGWAALPASLVVDSVDQLWRELLPALRSHDITLRTSTTGFQYHSAANPPQSAPADLQWLRRDPAGMEITLSLESGSGATVAQKVMVLPAHPLRLTASPPSGDYAAVTIENPTGAPITGRVIGGSNDSLSSEVVTFAQGDTRKVVSVKGRYASNGSFDLGLRFEEQAPSGKYVTTLISPAGTYSRYDDFASYDLDAVIPSSEYNLSPDGDAKVASSLAMRVVQAPPGLPGRPRKALRVRYHFEPGWKFLRVSPGTNHQLMLEGKPKAFGMWVNADGSGDVFNIRYQDSRGQTFQTSAGTLDWKGWRFVTFSLNATAASHWGGPDDGVIHYPIRFDTVALVDSPGGRGGNGEIYITDMTLIR